MKKRELNIILSVSTICLCIAIIMFGVYSAKNASLKVSGSVGFVAHNCNAIVTIQTNGDAINTEGERTIDGTMVRTETANLTQIKIEGSDKTESLPAFYFCDLTDSGNPNDIQLIFTIENTSEYPIAAKFSAIKTTASGVTIYNSDGINQWSDSNAETIEIETGKTNKIILVIKCLGNSNISDSSSNLSLKLDLYKNVKTNINFDLTGQLSASCNAISPCTWEQWINSVNYDLVDADGHPIVLTINSTDNKVEYTVVDKRYGTQTYYIYLNDEVQYGNSIIVNNGQYNVK